eukprot:7131461-Pyramimonas_sp.AAC.1
MCIANISQNETFHKYLSTDVMPTLLRHSFLYDLVRNRAVTAAESWLIQGVPHPDLSPSAAAGWCPCPLKISACADQCLAPRRQLELIGNMMHWMSVGTWYQYN